MLSLVHSCFDGIPEKERVLESEFSAHWPPFFLAHFIVLLQVDFISSLAMKAFYF